MLSFGFQKRENLTYLLFRQGLMQPSLSEICYVAEDYLKPIMPLPPPPKCWDYRTGMPSFCDWESDSRPVCPWRAHHQLGHISDPMVRISKQNLSPSTNSFVADSLLERGKQTIRLTAWVEPWDTASTLTSLATLVGVTAVGWMLRNELTTAFQPSMDYEQTFLLGLFMFNI